MAAAAAEAKTQYSAIVLGATGNVGGRIVQLLIKNPLCKKLVVVTRRKTGVFAAPKVFEVVVNMDRLEEDVAPYAQGVDVALAAFGVGKGSAKMPEEQVTRTTSRARWWRSRSRRSSRSRRATLPTRRP